MSDKAFEQKAEKMADGSRPDVNAQLLGQVAGAFAELWESGQNERALRLAEGLTAAFPGAPEMAAVLGDCHARCGDVARALETYVDAATRLPPDHPIAIRFAPVVAELRKAALAAADSGSGAAGGRSAVH